nr:hypothetical protein [Pseudomonas aeruginosa]
MTRLLLGLCLLFAGCAASPTTPRPVRVEVPLAVPCRVPDVRPPSWASATLQAGDSLQAKVRALLAERRHCCTHPPHWAMFPNMAP